MLSIKQAVLLVRREGSTECQAPDQTPGAGDFSQVEASLQTEDGGSIGVHEA